jgi:hypothetical protein
VGAVDAEWIGIHQDHAEICFVSCDDKELHALGTIVQVAYDVEQLLFGLIERESIDGV